MRKSIPSGAAFLAVLASMPAVCAAADPGKPASPDAAAQVDALFAEWDSTHSPGCSMAVSKEGAIVYERGYGMANLEYGVPNTPATSFHIASLSKQFTTAAIVLLAQEGRLSIDDPVRKYVPELADFGAPITIRHLIHHTSGLRDQWGALGVSGWRYSRDLITHEDAMSVIVRQRKLNFPPGTKYSYSNTGYTLMAEIVKRVSGKTLRQFTQARLFGPLGMHDTFFRDDFREIVPGFAYGYTREEGRLETSVTNFDTVGATSLVTTVRDLMLWEENFHTAQVGGKEFIRQMLEPGTLGNGQRIPYGFGLYHEPYRGLPTVGHAGGDAGYATHLVRFPEQHLSVAVLCNTNDVDPGKLAGRVAGVYLGDLMQPEQPEADSSEESSRDAGAPRDGSPVMAQARALERYAGVYASEEIDIPYRVALEDGRLTMSSLKSHSQPLQPLAPDLYRAGWLVVKFVRSPGGRITGFTLAGEGEAPYEFSRIARGR